MLAVTFKDRALALTLFCAAFAGVARLTLVDFTVKGEIEDAEVESHRV